MVTVTMLLYSDRCALWHDPHTIQRAQHKASKSCA